MNERKERNQGYYSRVKLIDGVIDTVLNSGLDQMLEELKIPNPFIFVLRHPFTTVKILNATSSYEKLLQTMSWEELGPLFDSRLAKRYGFQSMEEFQKNKPEQVEQLMTRFKKFKQLNEMEGINE